MEQHRRINQWHLAFILGIVMAAFCIYVVITTPFLSSNNQSSVENIDQKVDELEISDAPVSSSSMTSSPALKTHRSELIRSQSTGLGTSTTWRVEGELEMVAQEVIEWYANKKDVRLEQDGYLDLLGNVWSMLLVSEEGWVETVYIDARESSDAFVSYDAQNPVCTLTIYRMGTS